MLVLNKPNFFIKSLLEGNNLNKILLNVDYLDM